MPEAVLVESPRIVADAIFSADVLAGDAFVHEIQRGQFVRIVDLEGNQAVDTLFYNAADYTDRYSAQDTIRAQANIYLTTGTKLISTQRNVLLTHRGRHLRPSRHAGRRLRHGEQHGALRHREAPHARLPAELPQGRAGVVRRDRLRARTSATSTANINFFMNVPVTPEGGLTFEDGVSDAGKYVELRAEMDVLIVISNCPQLNNPCNAYNPTPVRVLVWNADEGKTAKRADAEN